MFTTRFQMVYFDRNVIRTNWRRINEGPMKRAGLMIRQRALRLIGHTVTARTPPRPPGQPPRTRVRTRNTYTNARGRTVRTPAPFRMIFSIPVNFGTGVLVGMVGFDSRAVPGRHELGLSASVRRGYWTYQRRPGAQPGNPIRTPQQMAAFRRRYLRFRQVPSRFPSRPFMRPALLQAAPLIPSMWRGSISRST
jgi:hypothetical protein